MNSEENRPQEPPRTAVKCSCGNDLQVHNPHLVQFVTPYLTQASLVPGWSTRERVCPHCKHICIPVFQADLRNVAWRIATPSGQPDERRIIIPTMSVGGLKNG